MSRRLRVGMLAGSATTAFGGVSQAMQSLSRALAARGNVEVEVFSLRRDAGSVLDFGGIPVHIAPVVGPRGFGYAPDLLAMLRRRELDCLHVHGVWMYLSVAARRWHAATGRPYVVSPHGMLDEWAMQSRSLKKRAARFLYEDAHLGGAACLHALCEAERRSIRRLGYESPICVVPNGVEPIAEGGGLPAWRKAYGEGANVLLFLGRVTPKKHLAELLEAWRRVLPLAMATSWRLVIVGPPDAGYGEELAAFVGAAGLSDSVTLAGPAFGDARAAAFRASDAFILPSVSEGQPMGALEALSCGLPVLLTPQCNLPEAESAGAAIDIEADPQGITAGLIRLFNMAPEVRRAMGERGRKLIAAQFDWDVSAASFEDLYWRVTTSLDHAIVA
jgi:glycosyltransferase involved in cell wall biosynthesis